MHIRTTTSCEKSKEMIKNELNNIKSDLGYSVYNHMRSGMYKKKRIILCIDRKVKINDDDERAFGTICAVLGKNSEVLKQKKYRDLICKYVKKFEIINKK